MCVYVCVLRCVFVEICMFVKVYVNYWDMCTTYTCTVYVQYAYMYIVRTHVHCTYSCTVYVHCTYTRTVYVVHLTYVYVRLYNLD